MYLMFLAFRCHYQWSVHNFKWFTLLRFYNYSISTAPVFPLNDRPQIPTHIGTIVKGEVAGIFDTHMGVEVHDFFLRLTTNTHPSQDQSQGTATFNGALKFLK